MNINRSLSRELALLSLGLIKDKDDFQLKKFEIEDIQMQYVAMEKYMEGLDDA